MNLVQLNEWCMEKSRADKQVELIGAFHFHMKNKGLLKATPERYAAEFEAFRKMPA